MARHDHEDEHSRPSVGDAAEDAVAPAHPSPSPGGRAGAGAASGGVGAHVASAAGRTSVAVEPGGAGVPSA